MSTNTVFEIIEAAQQRMSADLAAFEKRVQARLDSVVPPAPPTPLERLSDHELVAKAHKRELPKEAVKRELNRRRTARQEEVEKALEARTATALAEEVKKAYLAERSAARREVIIKSAMDESIARMTDAQDALTNPGLSKAERRELEFQERNEQQFQNDLLGSGEAVAKYYLECVNRPAPDPQSQAAEALEKSAGEGELMSQQWLKMQRLEKLRETNPSLWAIEKAQKPLDEEREAQYEYLKSLRRRA